MDDHWLVRPATVRMLWIAFIVVLALTVLAGALVGHETHFTIEGVFGFSAWYGYLSCVGLILIAKAIGFFLKRPDGYYRKDHD